MTRHANKHDAHRQLLDTRMTEPEAQYRRELDAGRPDTPGKPDTPNDALYGPQKRDAIGVPSDHRSKYGITRDETAFMQAVVAAANRELDGYHLLDSMRSIRDQYTINEQKLIENGYVKRHAGVAQRIYYSVTQQGQEACRATIKHGREIGDIGADTPHRVGIDLTRMHYASQPHVYRVELATRENGARTDVTVINTDQDRVATIEVEGGRTSADTYPSTGNIGINDYDSVRKDYDILADAPGESVWVVRNYEIAGAVLRALRGSDTPRIELPTGVIESVESASLPINDFNDNYIDQADWDGIDELLTFRQLRNRLR